MSRETSYGRATVKQLCAAFSISRQALHAARKPRVPRPPSGPRRPPRPSWAAAGVILERARAIVSEHPAWGVRKVWAVLRREGIRAGQKRVWAIMRDAGLTLEPVAARERTSRGGHVMVADSNRRWSTDLTTVWTRQQGTVAVVPVLDCGDRYALAVHVTKSQESDDILLPVERSLWTTFGHAGAVPDGLELLTDHGPQYTGADCDELCKSWHVEHLLSAVGRPTGNSGVERFIETMKIEVIWTRDWETIEELQAALDAWLAVYNGERPHQALGWLTPAERRSENLGVPLDAVA